ncbi:related to isochorismate synthase (MenF) [Desulfotalea psychrophila LSv54]|uniref:Related to isochorismate synthase (MenF) n=2 Tax=Desulfotalea psychrophila TaxID=84980 RepID=Q6ARP2_DESPS|nr:related to isochorismate synthase (MenF) [Desulfotalea psychrophila LSv54]
MRLRHSLVDPMKPIKKTLPQLLQLCLDKKLCFASYREPGCDIVTLAQDGGEPLRLSVDHEISEQRGFAIAPFVESDSCRPILISPDLISVGDAPDESLFARLEQFGGNSLNGCGDIGETYQCDHAEYLQEVDSLVTAIEAGRFAKAVLSRVEIIRDDIREKVVATYIRMCARYPHSLVYIFQADGHLWLGATPEILASVGQGKLQTIALAATRKNTPENQKFSAWSEKERQEQQYVTDYINDLLISFDLKSVKRGLPYPRQAGNMLHLCTEFSCDSHEIGGKLSPLLQALHPTPAVCGMPKEAARTFLHGLEKHDRQYYSGFLGPVNISPEQISLYVNLRCMQVCRGYAQVYVGGGITSDSVAEDEWTETVLKTKTILSALDN